MKQLAVIVSMHMNQNQFWLQVAGIVLLILYERSMDICRAAERGGGRGATCPGPQTSRGPQLEKYPKIEQGPIKIGASTRH